MKYPKYHVSLEDSMREPHKTTKSTKNECKLVCVQHVCQKLRSIIYPFDLWSSTVRNYSRNQWMASSSAHKRDYRSCYGNVSSFCGVACGCAARAPTPRPSGGRPRAAAHNPTETGNVSISTFHNSVCEPTTYRILLLWKEPISKSGFDHFVEGCWKWEERKSNQCDRAGSIDVCCSAKRIIVMAECAMNVVCIQWHLLYFEWWCPMKNGQAEWTLPFAESAIFFIQFGQWTNTGPNTSRACKYSLCML